LSIRKITALAVLTAIALVIFIIELQIPNPVPIPGVKLGLANIITLYAIYHYSAKEAALVVLARIILAFFFGGNAISLIYSLAGGLLCLSGMLALRRFTDEKRIWVCSVFGAALHNIGQITAAVIITGTIEVLAYLPVLLISGCAAGLFTGLCAQVVTPVLRRALKWFDG
jgi:heptaprenyl diphosphate synthase